MRCVSALAFLFALAAPASAELRDVILSREGETAWIQLVFDETPANEELIAETGGLAAMFSVSGDLPPAIETVAGEVLRGISFAREDGRIRAEFDLAVTWSDARIRVESDRLIVRLSGVSSSGDALPASHLTPPQAGAEPLGSEIAMSDPSEQAFTPESETNDLTHDADNTTGAIVAGGPADLTSGTGDGANAAVPPGDDACAAADARIVDDPWDLDAMIVQAECARSNGNAAEAAALLERVTAMDPERFSALLMLAEIEAESGDRDGARALYEMAAQAARTDGEAAAAMARMRALAD